MAPTPRQVMTHYRRIAEAVSIPIVLYHNIPLTAVDLRTEHLVRLFEEGAIGGVKMSNPEPDRICELLQATGGRLFVYAGIDTVAFEGLCHGAHGWISGIPSIVPGFARRVYEALAERSDLPAARELWARLAPLMRLQFSAYHSRGEGAFLVAHNLLMPTVQMLLRASRKPVRAPEDYLLGKAHPVVFDSGSLDVTRMVAMARALKPDQVPPLVRLRVEEEDDTLPGVDYFEAGPAEKLFDTVSPASPASPAPRAGSGAWWSRPSRRAIPTGARSRSTGGCSPATRPSCGYGSWTRQGRARNCASPGTSAASAPAARSRPAAWISGSSQPTAATPRLRPSSPGISPPTRSVPMAMTGGFSLSSSCRRPSPDPMSIPRS
jgi:hypothetical protein